MSRTHPDVSPQYSVSDNAVTLSAINPQSGEDQSIGSFVQPEQKVDYTRVGSLPEHDNVASNSGDISGSSLDSINHSEQDTTLIDNEQGMLPKAVPRNVSRRVSFPRVAPPAQFRPPNMASHKVSHTLHEATKMSPMEAAFTQQGALLATNWENSRLTGALQAVSHLEEYIKFLQAELVVLRSENKALKESHTFH